MIPCRKNKCILFPVCVNKEVIFCSKLHSHIEKIVEDYKGKYRYFERKLLFGEVKNGFPKLKRVFSKDKITHLYMPAIDIRYPLHKANYLVYSHEEYNASV